MSEVKNNSKAKVWGAPDFPVSGRLPTDVRVVIDNYDKQTAEEDCFCQQTNPRGQKQHSKGCHSLHISLFFDGTNNNEPNDTKKNHPSNIAKLFHASIQGPKAKGKGYFFTTCPVLAPHSQKEKLLQSSGCMGKMSIRDDFSMRLEMKRGSCQ